MRKASIFGFLGYIAFYVYQAIQAINAAIPLLTRLPM